MGVSLAPEYPPYWSLDLEKRLDPMEVLEPLKVVEGGVAHLETFTAMVQGRWSPE